MMNDDHSQITPLRERLAEIEAAQVREHMSPIMREMESASRMISRSAKQAEQSVFSFQRYKRELWAVTILVSVLSVLVFCAIVFIVVPSIDPHWMLTEQERRHVQIGQQVDRVWPSLSEEEQQTLEEYLNRESD